MDIERRARTLNPPPAGIDWSAVGVLACTPSRCRELAGSFPQVAGYLQDLALLDPQTQSGRRYEIAGRIAAVMQAPGERL